MYGGQRTIQVIVVAVPLLLLPTFQKCGSFPVLPQIVSDLQLQVMCSANGNVEDRKSLICNVQRSYLCCP